MTFQQLQHLLAVHRTGSFSLAAKEMFVSQSAVSNAISGLEQELGCRIFVRSAHGLSLTPEGTRIVDLANGICERQTLPLPSAYRLGSARTRRHCLRF